MANKTNRRGHAPIKWTYSNGIHHSTEGFKVILEPAKDGTDIGGTWCLTKDNILLASKEYTIGLVDHNVLRWAVQQIKLFKRRFKSFNNNQSIDLLSDTDINS